MAFAVDAVYLMQVTGAVELPRAVWRVFFELIQECSLALALFAVVMFIGCLRRSSALGMRLRGIRGELSIIAWILTLGHVVFYLITYVPRLLGSGQTNANVWASFAVALALLVLLLLLGVTSFKFVKKRMSAATWKKVQWWAYVFFGLVYVHLMLLLVGPALAGGIAAQQSVVIYTVTFGVYALVRIYRAYADAVNAPEEGR